jgi:hypothetical protein
MRLEQQYDLATSKPSSLKIEDDYRRQYLPVSNLFSFDPTANINLQRKLTNSEILSILKRKKKELKRWREPKKGMNLKVHSHKLMTRLYEFYPSSGTMVIPYEIIIFDTNSGIEFKIQEKYPDLVQWNLQLMSVEALKRYYGMIKELLGGINKEDFKDVLYFFFDHRYFYPHRSFKPWIWYDVRTLDIKPFPIKGVQDYPAIILKGYMYFWGELWFEKYLRESLIEKESGVGYRNFTISPNVVPPLFLTYPNRTLVYDWMTEKIGTLIKQEDNIVSNIFKNQLGLTSFKDVKITTTRSGNKDFKIIFENIFLLPFEKQWGSHSKVSLKQFSNYLPNKKMVIQAQRQYGKII